MFSAILHPHSRSAACSGPTNVAPREAGVVRGEAPRDAPVPDSWWVSIHNDLLFRTRWLFVWVEGATITSCGIYNLFES